MKEKLQDFLKIIEYKSVSEFRKEVFFFLDNLGAKNIRFNFFRQGKRIYVVIQWKEGELKKDRVWFLKSKVKEN